MQRRGKPQRHERVGNEQEQESGRNEEEVDGVDTIDHSTDENAARSDNTSSRTAPAKSSSSTSPVTATSTTSPPPDNIRDTPQFLLLRTILLLIIFYISYTYVTDNLILPYFQPHRTRHYQEAEERRIRNQIQGQVCPDGLDCNYDLQDQFRP